MFEGDWRNSVIAGLAFLPVFIPICAHVLGFQLGEEYGNAEYSADYHKKYAADKIKNECLTRDLVGRELGDRYDRYNRDWSYCYSF